MLLPGVAGTDELLIERGNLRLARAASQSRLDGLIRSGGLQTAIGEGRATDGALKCAATAAELNATSLAVPQRQSHIDADYVGCEMFV